MGGVARRQFLTAAGGVLAWLLLARAARANGRRYRIGMVPDCQGAYCEWYAEAMRSMGWREGREFESVHAGLRYGDRPDEAARRVVAQQPDLIYTVGTHYVVAVRRYTTTLPIVMWASGYPVEAGIAESLARPGLNVTGNATYAGTEIWSKLLGLLREVRPGTKRVGVLMSYLPPLHPAVETEVVYRDLREGAARLGLSLHFSELVQSAQARTALDALAAQAPDAVLLTTGAGVWPVREQVARYALERRWPTITDIRWAPEDALQPLMTYGPAPRVLIGQAAPYIVRILRDGAKAGELPIQQPAKFEFFVNLRTAASLQLEMPASLLLRADQVVQ